MRAGEEKLKLKDITSNGAGGDQGRRIAAMPNATHILRGWYEHVRDEVSEAF